MEHWAYVAMLAFCLAGSIPLVPVFGLRLHRRWGMVLASIVLTALPFVAWDVAATATHQWRFDPAQVLGLRILGLPIEEYGFFVVVPFAAIATFEAVGEVLRRVGRRHRR